jgi:hypothetical protein
MAAAPAATLASRAAAQSLAATTFGHAEGHVLVLSAAVLVLVLVLVDGTRHSTERECIRERRAQRQTHRVPTAEHEHEHEHEALVLLGR